MKLIPILLAWTGGALLGSILAYQTLKRETPIIAKPQPTLTGDLAGYEFRIQSDGHRFFVQKKQPWWGAWSDDVWGGYFTNYAGASNRLIEVMNQSREFEKDQREKQAFKTVEEKR